MAPTLPEIDLAQLDPTNVVAFLVLVTFGVLFVVGLRDAADALPFGLSAPLQHLRRLTDEAIEEGRPLHVSAGTGAIGSPVTTETLAGLDLGRRLAKRAAAGGIPTIGSSPDPVTYATFPTALGGQRVGGDGTRHASSVFAPDRATYATEVMHLLGSTKPGASVMAGSFGDEYLLLAASQPATRVPQAFGSGSPGALPLLAVASEAPLLGEELYNAGPLLEPSAAKRASLRAQNGIRELVVLVIVLAAIAKTVGVL